MDKVAAFCIGNAVGLTILFTGIMISAPKKMKESAELQKQQNVSVAQRALHVVAIEKIETGREITESALAVRSSDGKPTDALSEELRNATLQGSGLLGKRAKSEIQKNTVITARMVSE